MTQDLQIALGEALTRDCEAEGRQPPELYGFFENLN
jgi:hypothetical protein